MSWLLRFFHVIFWLAIAYIPLALNRVVIDFMVTKCMVGSECLNYAMPLIVNIQLVDWAACILLWPLAAWNLGGLWLWRRWRTRKGQSVGS
jgi:hypothetical protein